MRGRLSSPNKICVVRCPHFCHALLLLASSLLAVEPSLPAPHSFLGSPSTCWSPCRYRSIAAFARRSAAWFRPRRTCSTLHVGTRSSKDRHTSTKGNRCAAFTLYSPEICAHTHTHTHTHSCHGRRHVVLHPARRAQTCFATSLESTRNVTSRSPITVASCNPDTAAQYSAELFVPVPKNTDD